MLFVERRTAQRRPRLATARFTWEGRPRTAVMTDLSVVGAFLSTNVFPPTGTTLALSFDVGGLSPLTLRGRVVHLLDGTAGVRGFGIRWLDAAGAGSDPGPLLRRFLDADVICRYEPEGRVSWALESAEPEAIYDQPADRRRSVRCSGAATVSFFVRRQAREGVVRDVSLRGLWIALDGDLPSVGDLLTIRYPLAIPVGYVRVVGRVVRLCEGGFAVQVVRLDERGCSGAFATHLESLCVR